MVQSPRDGQAEACNFIKKETLAQMLSCEFCEISKNTFLYNTSGSRFCNAFIINAFIYVFIIFLFGMFELEGPNLFCSRFLIYLKNICQLTCLFSVEVNLHKSKILLKCVSQTIEIDREFRLYFRNKYI